MRIEPPPSLAWAIGTTPAATAAALPPDDPPGEKSGFHGLRVAPCDKGSVTHIRPNSGVAVLPSANVFIWLKASTKRSFVVAGGAFSNARLPLRVGQPL